MSMGKTEIKERPPVVVIMGHVDHGKSALLDYIRKSNIVAGEAGGITQHLGAYEVEHESENGKKKITFLDTPGHEAFGAIRARGARVADIAVLVVSAEDGVKTQTLEALDAIKESDIPFVVAINKIDKPGADVMRTKSSLVEHAIYIEGMGGDIPAVPISAKTGEGVDELLDTILLMAEMEELVGDTQAPVEAVVIEAHRDPKKGVAATMIIKNGVLRTGTFILADTALAPVRIMEDHTGKQMKELSFSSPVRIIGFDTLPLVGTECEVFTKKKDAEKKRDENKRNAATQTVVYNHKDKRFVIPLVVKADVVGTLEAIEHELQKIENDRIVFKVVVRGVGDISENDIQTVVGTDNPVVVGFNVGVDARARDVAYQHGIETHTFDIIYKMSEWLADIAKERTPVETVKENMGEVKVIKVFSSQKDTYVLGGKVKKGVLKLGSMVTIVRRGEPIAEGEIINLQAQKQNVEKVEEGNEFGAQVRSDMEIIDGDRMQIFEMVQK